MKKIIFLKKIITFKNIAFVCYRFLKNQNLKKNLKTASKQKLLRATSQKIDFFLEERENMDLKIELIL